MGALGALLYSVSVSRKIAFSVTVYTFILLVTLFNSHSLFNFQPKPHGGLSKMARATTVNREFTRWDPLGRIEVYSFGDEFAYMYMPDPVPIKAMFQDGDAGSLLLNVREGKYDYTNFFYGSIFSLVYQLRQNPITLAIGLGGGHDVMRAQYYKSKEITGVEINSTTVSLVKKIFSDYLADPYGKENVTIENMDGRYFVRDKRNQYDIIQIAGADTDTSNLTTGALVVSENYLYTTQAFRDYFTTLKPDGILSIIRFGVREPMLILSTAIAAMREMGIKEPYKNIVVVKQAINVNVLMKRVPFTADEIRTVKLFMNKINDSGKIIRFPVNDVIGYEAVSTPEFLYLPLSGWNSDNYYTDFMNSVRLQRERNFVAEFGSNIEPLTDDKPFFFQYEKPENIFKHRKSVIYNLFIVSFQIFIFSVLAIFLPVYLLRRKQTRIRYNFAYVLYFFSIGFGFIFIEIGLIQKTALFLGHPTYSFISVVFFILIFSGLGSLFSGIVRKDGRKLVVISIVAVMLLTVLYLFALDDILNLVLPGNMFFRMIIVGLFIAPLGFALGMPFPKGLQIANVRDENFVPVAIGINGVASVLGSAASMPLAMLFGFSTIFVIAVSAYFLGLLTMTFSSNTGLSSS
jgi:hypothetical protein